jgi:AcrR family transcriptional regulator
MNASRPRTRLSPDARRAQLLDTAKDMVIADGLQAFTMEGLAREAGVSAPLVYNYFDGRPQLLQALLAREYERFVAETTEALREAESFEDIVRISVTSNFDHHAPGNILPLLQSQPEIASAIRAEQQRIGRRNAKFLVQAAAEQYHLTTAQAQLAVSMSSGASIAAAELAANSKLDREDTIEQAVRYILSGIERIGGS